MHKPVFAWPKRLKHIAIKHVFMYNHIQHKDISVNYIPMNKNLADFLTKHITSPKLVTRQNWTSPPEAECALSHS